MLVVLLVVVVSVGGGGSDTSAAPSTSVQAPVTTGPPSAGPSGTELPTEPETGAKTITVVYEVTGDGALAGSIVYWNGKSIALEELEPLPWSRTLHSKDAVMTSLSGLMIGTGTIACRILVNGSVVEEQRVTGENPYVDCEGPVARP